MHNITKIFFFCVVFFVIIKNSSTFIIYRSSNYGPRARAFARRVHNPFEKLNSEVKRREAEEEIRQDLKFWGNRRLDDPPGYKRSAEQEKDIDEITADRNAEAEEAFKVSKFLKSIEQDVDGKKSANEKIRDPSQDPHNFEFVKNTKPRGKSNPFRFRMGIKPEIKPESSSDSFEKEEALDKLHVMKTLNQKKSKEHLYLKY